MNSTSSAGSTATTTVSAFRDDALAADDAVELSRRLAAGEVTREELVNAAIERARAVNPQLNAIAHEAFDRALAEAAAAPSGPFGGLPTFVKDTDPVAGMPLRMGSHALPDKPAHHSSPFVEQFLGTGLICLGKTTLPELGLTATTESLAYGPTRNPWNTAHSTGGSSGGSSALVAAGVVPLAHANDGGGSIRIPASCCGLVGLKTSRGRLLGAEGGKFFPIDIIVQGAVTRTVRDAIAFVNAAEQLRPSPLYALIGAIDSPGTKPLRVACFTDSAVGVESDAECRQAVVDTARTCEALGHNVEWMRCPFDGHLVDDFFAYWGFAPFGLGLIGRQVFGKGYDHSRIDDWSRGLSDQFRRSLGRMPAVLWRLRRFAKAYEAFFERFDVILTPTLAQPPMPIGHISPDVPFDTAVERVMHYAAFTPMQNIGGGPAISLPLARSVTGLPIGVQLGANRGADRRILELALALEEAMPWPTLA